MKAELLKVLHDLEKGRIGEDKARVLLLKLFNINEMMKISWEAGINNCLLNTNENGYYIGKEEDFETWIKEEYPEIY